MIKIDSEEAYTAAVTEFSDMIYRIAYQNMLNIADAEDVVQEVLFKLLKHRGAFADREHIKAWLIRVTVNQCKDIHKILFRRKEVSIEDIEEFDAASDESDDYVFLELSKLPKEDRNVIYLYYYEGYSIREIAEILKKNQNTVNARLTRARRKLEKILLEDDYL
ncbi:MAG: RNA polymerase sigma factor [Lachnospiraceae bacterium]|nr:RNA polymerase sigma factor [Lachnospiraceae bacterium]